MPFCLIFTSPLHYTFKTFNYTLKPVSQTIILYFWSIAYTLLSQCTVLFHHYTILVSHYTILLSHCTINIRLIPLGNPTTSLIFPSCTHLLASLSLHASCCQSLPLWLWPAKERSLSAPWAWGHPEHSAAAQLGSQNACLCWLNGNRESNIWTAIWGAQNQTNTVKDILFTNIRSLQNKPQENSHFQATILV